MLASSGMLTMASTTFSGGLTSLSKITSMSQLLFRKNSLTAKFRAAQTGWTACMGAYDICMRGSYAMRRRVELSLGLTQPCLSSPVKTQVRTLIGCFPAAGFGAED